MLNLAEPSVKNHVTATLKAIKVTNPLRRRANDDDAPGRDAILGVVIVTNVARRDRMHIEWMQRAGTTVQSL